MKKVNTQHDSYTKLLPMWTLINDCVAGEEAIKAKGDVYLPRPNGTDTSEENIYRYEKEYKLRAVFFNNCKSTINNMVGQIFSKEHTIEVDPLIESVVENTTGGGVSIIQSAKESLSEVLKQGRSGLLVDYPKVEGATTRADLLSGGIRPNIIRYDTQNVINWRWKREGAIDKLTLVVISELEADESDEFALELIQKYRVLRLVNNIYNVEVYKKVEGEYILETQTIPTDASGNVLNFIPFTFIGSENNDPSPDNPPMADLAKVNIAHYRNSADYEESVYLVGQPTLVVSGLDEEWVKNVMGGKIAYGSRATVMLPTGGNASLVQAQPNTLPKEAMDAKEKQMRALGAKLVEDNQVTRTATEATIDNAAKTSILASSTKNVSEAYKAALDWCALFVGATKENIFKLNDEFNTGIITTQEKDVLLKMYQAEAITFEELRANLKKGGIELGEDEAAKLVLDTETIKLDE